VIGYLEGTIVKLASSECIVLVQGIGYLVSINTRISDSLSISQSVALWIESTSHEGQTRLFGFLSQEDQQWFSWLVHIPGVGGRVAQNILSMLSPQELHSLIISDHTHLLKKAEGVGPKLANRIISELKDKALKWTGGEVCSTVHQDHQDVPLALCALGYTYQQASQALRHVKNNTQTQEVSELIRLCLQHING
jgi:Holliday junction DNA helicase RuvA